MRKTNILVSIMHWLIPVVTFGGGFLVSRIILISGGNLQIYNLFRIIMAILILAALAYENTYKYYRVVFTLKKIMVIILLVYALPFVAGFCTGFFLS
jgi:hypothetical protein